MASAPGATASGESVISTDVLVVGGGINGAGIARDLAGRGLKVLLCEQDDLAAHTSSSSTKLIHGGLRYLEYYEFGLVRKALAERERLLRSAPHIMWPLRFVMPHDPSMRPVWMIRIGLFLYDHLAKREWLPASGAVALRASPLGVPLKADFTRGFVYSDGWVDDARLVVLNAVDAAAHGATVMTRCPCVGAERVAGGWRARLQPQGGAPVTVQARALVNAAGPWAAAFLRDQVQRPGSRSLRLVKGSHIVVPRIFEHDHAYIFQNPDKRIIFAIPYEGRFTLIGTTDVEVHGEPGSARVDDDEVAYLCAQASRYFAKAVTPADVVWRYTGVRPLLDDESGDASAVTRDYLLEFDTGASADQAPMLTVWGGKITTFRKLAEEATDALLGRLGERRPAWTETALLPGGDLSAWIGAARRPDEDFARFVEALARQHPQVDRALLHRWARAYGSRIELLLAQAGAPGASFGDEVVPGLYEAELDHLFQHEWARSADDVLWRRSKLGLHLDTAQRQRVAQWWSDRHPEVATTTTSETAWN
ncbi:glycerol-3-phosphate dehydrogenase [Ideonella sp. A 288]|uniref:glycerol-3-phosphate dehydrogenase n=1 Tax=Ideonella sp. A 288 TaxID=1962181 RepID=UPI0018FE734F|nr:glycerol-3-phosphate dehydrogenase [Ideonella sp. A 288]